MSPLNYILKKPNSLGQLEFGIERPSHPDRNSTLGGRSFYFFDLDDNVINLPTPLFVFHKNTHKEVVVTTHEFATISPQLGKPGPWLDYEVRQCAQTGSFRRFRNKNLNLFEKLFGKKQPLEEDILLALKSHHKDQWMGPSWQFFWHAVHNSRPLSIITARGHTPQTIKDGISHMVRHKHLTKLPNYLSVYPVSNLEMRKQLGDDSFTWSTARLKQEAIIASVHEAFKIYGQNPNHRFGMSDDDPKNLELIVEVMHRLKSMYPKNQFFVIDTHGGRLIKQEILKKGEDFRELTKAEQLALFD